MASVSVSHLIIFIAAMVVAASVAGALTSTVNDISSAIDEQGPSVSDDIRSDITIINDAGSSVKNGSGAVVLYVKNTGDTELPTQPDRIDVLINGQFSLADNVTIVTSGDGVWRRNDVAEIAITDPPTLSGDNRVKLVVGGAEDTFIWEE